LCYSYIAFSILSFSAFSIILISHATHGNQLFDDIACINCILLTKVLSTNQPTKQPTNQTNTHKHSDGIYIIFLVNVIAKFDLGHDFVF